MYISLIATLQGDGGAGEDLARFRFEGHIEYRMAAEFPSLRSRQNQSLDMGIDPVVQSCELGVYAVAVGSAQSLKNGGYTFEAGFINPASIYSRAVETSAEGKVVYAPQVEGLIVYRSFRVADMYSAPVK